MGKSNIEWTGDTWNLIRGCSRKSAGCTNCYAEVTAYRLEHYLKVPKYKGLTVMRGGRPGWTGEVVFDAEKLLEPLRRKKPTTYFVNSMSDLFHERLTNEEIASVFAVMAACPQHTFQILTKRSARMVAWFQWLDGAGALSDGGRWSNCADHLMYRASSERALLAAQLAPAGSKPLPNVHLGVSVECQDTAEERIPDLLKVPNALPWISMEPLLEAVDLDLGRCDICGESGEDTPTSDGRPWCTEHEQECSYGHWLDEFRGLAWVVVGGESGPRSRPFDLAWARSIVEQCKENDVPVFVKQLGAMPVENLHVTGATRIHKGRMQAQAIAEPLKLKSRKGADMNEWPEELRVRELPRPKS